MYITFGREAEDSVGLDFSFSGTSNIRKWDIKASQIECDAGSNK